MVSLLSAPVTVAKSIITQADAPPLLLDDQYFCLTSVKPVSADMSQVAVSLLSAFMSEVSSLMLGSRQSANPR